MKIVIVGDNDRATPNNPGLNAAHAAAAAVGGFVAVPEFNEGEEIDGKVPTDLNDLFRLRGEDAVRAIFPGEDAQPERENDEAAIARLAKLKPLEYDRVRNAEAVRLGVRTSTLDAMVKAVRGGIGDTEDQDDLCAELELWPHPVNGAELLDALEGVYSTYMVLPATAATALALWTLHAHAHDTAFISPLLAITSPTPACGKTTLLGLLRALTPKPLEASDITPASLFRAVEKWRPTLLIDEADTFLGDSNELRGVINCGHSRTTAFVIRAHGDDHEPRQFTTWAPKAIALIGTLHPTLASRAIHVELRRMAPHESVATFRPDRLQHLEPLLRQAARWAADHEMRLRAADPDIPATLTGRPADNWRHMLAIADAAGGTWSERARRAAEVLTARDAGDTPTIMLLADIRSLFKELKADRLLSAEIVEALGQMEDRPWPEWKKGQPITQTQLAALLSPFKIVPNTIRGRPKRGSGYKLSAFADAFARYLPDEPCRHDNPRKAANRSPSKTLTPEAGVMDEMDPKPAESETCHGVMGGDAGGWEAEL